MTLLSVVAPVYNESAGVEAFVARVEEVLSAWDGEVEIILIDDGSADESWARIAELADRDPKVRGLKLSRNFGKDPALYAGLEHARGDVAVVLDSDLQHPPELITEMLAQWQAGAEIVIARKRTRPDQSFVVRLGSNLWGRAFAQLSGIDVQNTTDFRLISRRVREKLLEQGVHRPFFRGDSSILGFHTVMVEFDPAPRATGRSSFRIGSLARLATRSITTFSTKPLHLVSAASLFLMIAALVLGIQTLVQWFNGNAQTGFTTVILLILFVGSLLLFGLGVIGEYIAAIFEAVRGRAAYIIETDTREMQRDPEDH
ncbi:glycosyltransferase [Agromyces protaetiae]|uniref:Glycosyltransferase n=1 Tax=Agromyces protaetiae TaxID=2509455 RepID=A0A4P6FJ18_9MICO|nr:glycosyltransferase family 2 protein [Agromyces protaetiae]QAY74579.1 glycosyltransferase [Agromyces protaetiae]